MLGRTGNAFMLVGPDGRVLGASDTAAAALGFETGAALTDLEPRALAARFTPETAEGHDERLPAARWLADGRDERVLRFRDPLDGWDRWALLKMMPGPLGDTPKGRLCVVQDITPFRRREQAARLLDEATLRLTRALTPERVFEHAAVTAVPVLADETVVVDLGPDGLLLPAAWYLPGPSSATRAQALVRGLAPLLADVVRGGRVLLLKPVRGEREERRSMLLAPVRHARETLALVILAMAADTGRAHHPSDRRLAEQLGERIGRALADARLQASERRRLQAAEEREAMLADLGSELRTQLPALLSACDRLEDRLPESERRVLRTIREQSRRLNATVDRLFTRDYRVY